jgi:hypothetical protein
MKEEWLHFLWKLKRLPLNLYTTKGSKIEIISPGFHNQNSGPDFFDARIKIDNIIWSGNVEIHIVSSDWNKHFHQFDESYKNVILHVVYQHDLEIQIMNETIPVLELKNLVSLEDLQKMKCLIESNTKIACEFDWKNVPHSIIEKQIESSFFNRLERKSLLIEYRLVELNQDELRLKLELLGKILLTKVNELPIIELISKVPVTLLYKISDSQRIALLLGVSGLIPTESNDEYVVALRLEAEFLMTKYGITSMFSKSWRFFGCRPSAYPTIRIVYFALLVNDEVLTNDFDNQYELLEWLNNKKLNLTDFWQSNTHFNCNSKHINSLTKDLKCLILTNFILPFFYWKFKLNNDLELLEELIELVIKLPPELNSKVNTFKKLGFRPKSMFQTQGLLELINEFCQNKKCLSCQIGTKIISR